MKNRNIPFGYRYANGIVEINPYEKEVLERIIKMYREGLSLLKISEQFNQEKIEYMPGTVKWGKSKLMRIIEDERYLGTDVFPQLIDQETFDELNRLKAYKNKQKNTDLSANIYKLNTPIICRSCGKQMQRRHDTRCRCHQRWICKNSECNEMVVISDEELLGYITELLNQAINNPDMIEYRAETEEPNMEICKMENEISRTLEGFGFDRDELLKKMMACASLKYREIDNTSRITTKLKADFEKSNPHSDSFGLLPTAEYRPKRKNSSTVMKYKCDTIPTESTESQNGRWLVSMRTRVSREQA